MNFKSIDKDKLYRVAIIVVLVIGVIVKLYKFGIIMDQTQSDEMGIGYDAWCLLNYGVDRHQDSWPVYFMNFCNGQSALYTYVLVLVMGVFGYSRFAIRFPALIFSAIAGVFGTLTAGELFYGQKKEKVYQAQLIFAFLYAVSPYTYMASRFALDCNLMFGCSAVFLFFLLKAVRTRRWPYYLAAGFFAGLTLYTYAISYIVLPVMLLLSIIYLIRTKSVDLACVVSFTIPLTILAFPLILVQYINYFDLEQFRIGIFTITKLQEYRVGEVGFDNFLGGILLGLRSVLWYDGIGYNTNKYFFTFYPMSVPFFFYGLYIVSKKTVISVKDNSFDGSALVLFWIIGEILAAGLMTGPNANRLNGIMIGVMVCIVYGITALMDHISERAKKPVIMALTASYLVYFVAFLVAYFTVIGFEHETTTSMCPEAIEFVKANDNLRDKVVASNIPPQFYMATLLPTPDKLDETSSCTDDHYTCYAYSEYETLREYFYNKGGTSMAYLVYLPTDDDMAVMEESGATVQKFGYSFYLYYWE